MVTEIGFLRRLYLDHLSEQVDYGSGPRSRVKNPGKWLHCEALIELGEDVEAPLIFTPEIIERTYIWSDQHFFHKNVIDFSERPYMNIDEMNETLVANYNDYVGDDDICFWVGDVGFGNTTQINELLEQCNGYKILIIGNHDFNGKRRRKLNFDETHLIYNLDVPGVSLVLTHYPMDNIYLPWFNVHGHLHNYPKLDTGNVLHFNVNCEAHQYRPAHINEIIKIAKMRTIAAGM